ncbi:TetR/AcrR family transcriptional regulator [Aeromicrobium sp.]|uniref:TetR/AcrR family transcriptional regulator n=1 Tax=Aeromicrobium sp. TaxID=1871063 RepID=UPI0019A14836|nr:TetR/AcrR family transcriptional regulator [Aeromicrobium sp.]MBC7632890.1 TetR/AcrR family transcriptional regulator [Aeromicrobium sp.]
MDNASKTARQRAREEITGEIITAARARLAEVGPGELSLRSVARDVGMASSAVYRSFPSRVDLLTALLVEAYDELGSATEAADPGGAPRDRWMAVCRATRAWALGHRHEYALLYGTPVTGYAAPQDTVVPATRVIVRLVQIVVSADPTLPQAAATFGAEVQGAVDSIADATGATVPVPDPEVIGRTLMAWSGLFGVISFELWGHLVGSISDHDAYFDQVALRLAGDIGIT